MVITRSTRIAPGTWRLAAPASLDSALITIRGENITVDFAGATLEGMPPDGEPDLAAGVAVRIEGGHNVRVLHAGIRGYRFGVIATGTRGLDIVGGDFSFSWKPRLYSLIEHESLVDWLSFHHNEQREWLRYGAGIYLEDVSGGVIRGNRAVQGMNGLMLARSDSLRILENDFSFNSGLGIGMYRSSDNIIHHNRLDFDVRGHSRFYHRGQDSADLLMFEQSSRNVVAWNSATHGGDGVFLWAGQSTMDSGTGGANDNVFWKNDFSYAPANGIEATFSRNTFAMNRAVGNDYGVWGGYSFGSKIVGNTFGDNRVGIAIEHGQNNVIAANLFKGDTTAISLWANPIEPSDWGYPRHRDTASRGYRIAHNLFLQDRVALRAQQTAGLAFTDNALYAVDSAEVHDTSAHRSERNEQLGWRDLPRATAVTMHEHTELTPPAVPGPHDWPRSALASRDRSAIVVDEWGPYDWRSPRLWPVDSSRAVPLRLAVLGPRGRWRAVSRRGIAAISKASGSVGDTIAVTPAADSPGDWELMLEYRGAATVSPRGIRAPAARPVRFAYSRFEPAADWAVKFFAWSDSTDPRAHADAFTSLLGGQPLLVRHEHRLDYEWYRPALAGVPQAHFALEATASINLAPGTWTLRTISDDAVRVWVDGALVIDDWAPHESVVDNAPLTGGRHEIRVQHYQVDGWTELRLDIVRGTQRSTGSPGPH
ncbi:MAG: NosD domain-containing protein [Gemmatimonadales bacterium]